MVSYFYKAEFDPVIAAPEEKQAPAANTGPIVRHRTGRPTTESDHAIIGGIIYGKKGKGSKQGRIRP